ncbi:DEAD/DEAH box family helicase [Streptococcus mutans NFSM1]|nr:DEAD/DEAH box family helicase [Streptococcus mutans NFSM1]NLQ90710.1 DEAD/DEAH box helicase [Streptococcus mutans]
MYQKRQIAYKMMAYQLNKSHQKQTLFDNGSYEKAFREDLEQVHSSVFL